MSQSQQKKMDLLKTGKVCMDCIAGGNDGIWPTECLQFDHREPDLKSGSIREFIHKPELLALEIAKCDIVCANHHAIRTRKRGVSERTRANIRASKATAVGRQKTREAAAKIWTPERHDAHAKAVVESQRRPEVLIKHTNSTAKSWLDEDIASSRKEGMKKSWENPTRKANLKTRPRVAGKFVKQSK